jgi:hypothetical protein
MTEAQPIQSIINTVDPPKEEETIDHTQDASITSTIVKTTGSAAVYVATSSVGRKAIFTGAMYFAGGAIVSTVGLAPVLVAGAIVWML